MGRLLPCVVSAAVILAADCAAQAPDPEWIRVFDYAPEDVHPIEVGDFGYPYVSVEIARNSLMLPFDTGNMVGISLSSALFDRLGLRADGFVTRRDSGGDVVSTRRVAEGVEVSVLGRDLGPTRVSELDAPILPGLVGPANLDAGHFTVDYASRRMALGTGRLPDRVPGFRSLPLVRSGRHPMLVLVRGTVEGRSVLLEIDTGKSRTVISPALTSRLQLKPANEGVRIESLRIGDLVFEVPSAKEIDQTGIDPDLPAPIMGGIGSDILSRFVWTLDYDAGVLWVLSR